MRNTSARYVVQPVIDAVTHTPMAHAVIDTKAPRVCSEFRAKTPAVARAERFNHTRRRFR
jgi:hypothetical protein